MINKIAFVTETNKGSITEISHESEEITIHTIKLKRKDTLILRVDKTLNEEAINKIENKFKKKLHRNVIVLDKTITGIEAVNR